MPPPAALSATLKIARLVQSCCLVAIIGLTANFISEIVSNDASPPGIFIGTLTVTCIATIYCLITLILLKDDILPFLASAIADSLVLIALIVVAVIIGKPLSYLKCGDVAAAGASGSAYAFATHLDSYLASLGSGKKVSYRGLIGASKAVCLEAKSIWGISIGLAIMFFFSAICCTFLWRLKKKGWDKVEG